jgi:hypothetical protein
MEQQQQDWRADRWTCIAAMWGRSFRRWSVSVENVFRPNEAPKSCEQSAQEIRVTITKQRSTTEATFYY